jgi:hypothetical protein
MVNKNVGLKSAVHCVFALRDFSKNNEVYDYIFCCFGQPIRPIHRLVIPFYGAIEKEECLGHIRQTYTISH